MKATQRTPLTRALATASRPNRASASTETSRTPGRPRQGGAATDLQPLLVEIHDDVAVLEHVDAQQAVHAQAFGRQHRQLGSLMRASPATISGTLAVGVRAEPPTPCSMTSGPRSRPSFAARVVEQGAAVGAGIDDEARRALAR